MSGWQGPLRGLVLCLIGLLAGCVVKPHSGDDSLYHALGEQAGIDRIVNQFIVEIGDEPAIRTYFEETDLERFHDKLAEQICQVSGGPCRYTGDPMDKVHTGMHITEAHFNRVVELLVKAMDKNRVPHPVQNQLLHALAPTRVDTIEQ